MKVDLSTEERLALRDCAETAYWDLARWFYKTPEGRLTPKERAKELGVPLSVAHSMNVQLVHLSEAIRKLDESLPEDSRLY